MYVPSKNVFSNFTHCGLVIIPHVPTVGDGQYGRQSDETFRFIYLALPSILSLLYRLILPEQLLPYSKIFYPEKVSPLFYLGSIPVCRGYLFEAF